MKSQAQDWKQSRQYTGAISPSTHSAKGASRPRPENALGILRKLSGQLCNIRVRTHQITNSSITGTVAKRHRNLFDLLGIEGHPGYLKR